MLSRILVLTLVVACVAPVACAPKSRGVPTSVGLLNDNDDKSFVSTKVLASGQPDEVEKVYKSGQMGDVEMSSKGDCANKDSAAYKTVDARLAPGAILATKHEFGKAVLRQAAAYGYTKTVLTNTSTAYTYHNEFSNGLAHGQRDFTCFSKGDQKFADLLALNAKNDPDKKLQPLDIRETLICHPSDEPATSPDSGNTAPSTVLAKKCDLRATNSPKDSVLIEEGPFVLPGSRKVVTARRKTVIRNGVLVCDGKDSGPGSSYESFVYSFDVPSENKISCAAAVTRHFLAILDGNKISQYNERQTILSFTPAPSAVKAEEAVPAVQPQAQQSTGAQDKKTVSKKIAHLRG